MTPLYVYGFTDEAIGPFTTRGRRLHTIAIADIHVVVDRGQPESTPLEAALRQQHGIVEAIARRCDALLPARYGSSIDRGRLEHVVAANRETLADALHTVRGRSQMTLRIPAGPAASPAQSPPSSPGLAYLARRRAEFPEPDPTVLAAVRRTAGDLIRGELMQPGRPGFPPAVFHLVDNERVARYRRRILALARTLTRGDIELSGPWPPFAFTPELGG